MPVALQPLDERKELLLKMGYRDDRATVMAHDPDLDLDELAREISELMAHGCPVAVAREICR